MSNTCRMNSAGYNSCSQLAAMTGLHLNLTSSLHLFLHPISLKSDACSKICIYYKTTCECFPVLGDFTLVGGICRIPAHESAGFCPNKSYKIEKDKIIGAYETFLHFLCSLRRSPTSCSLWGEMRTPAVTHPLRCSMKWILAWNCSHWGYCHHRAWWPLKLNQNLLFERRKYISPFKMKVKTNFKSFPLKISTCNRFPPPPFFF